MIKEMVELIGKYVNSYRKILKCSIVFMAIIVIMFALYHCCIRNIIPDTAAHLANNDQRQVIYNLSDDIKLSQIFVSPYDFNFLTLSFSDHDQLIEGETIISVKELITGDIVIQEVMSNHDIHYAAPVQISFSGIGGGKAEKEYEVIVEQRETQEIGLGIFGYSNEEKSTPAMVNDAEQDYSLSIGTHSYTNIYIYLVRIIFLLSGVLIGIMIMFSNSEKWKEEHFFCIICLVVGICIFLFLSLNNTNDGSYHYQNSYWYANKLLGIEEKEPNLINMRTDDAGIYQNSAHIYNGYLSTSYASEMYRIIKDFHWKSETKAYEKVEFLKLTQSTIWDRLPGVISLAIGRLFNLGTYPCVWLARLLSLAAYIIIVMYAIKEIPVGKMALGFIAALPRCIYSAVTITYDSMINAISFLAIALFLKLILKELEKREKAVLLVVSFILGACKGGIYLPLLLMGILAFKKKNKQRNLFVFSTWMIAGISMLINYGGSIFRYLGFSVSAGVNKAVEGTSAVTQTAAVQTVAAQPSEIIVGSLNYDILYPLRSPVGYINLLCRTLISEIDNYMGNIIQGDPHIELIFPGTLVFLFIALIMYSAIEDVNSKVDFKLSFKLVSFMIILIESIGIMTVFLTVTRMDSEVLWGVNGRYFIPFLPLVFLLFSTPNLCIEQDTKKKLYLPYAVAEALYLFFYFKIVFFV